MNLFDLSKFEKTAEDKHSTTMRHSDGHEIRIVHSSLPKLKREQLKRLKFAKGGDVERLDTGGDVSSNDTNGSEASDGGAPAQTSSPAAGTTINIQAGGSPQPAPQAATPAPIMQTPDIAKMQNPVEAGSMAQSAQGSQEPVKSVPGQPTNPQQTPFNPDFQTNPGQINQMTQQSDQGQKAINMEAGKQASEIQAGKIASDIAIANNIQNNIKTYGDQVKAISDYTLSDKNQINPNAYLQNAGVGAKLANAFGLLAGGLKQGLIGGDNPAMTFINNQIQRDIDAQKNKQENVKTVYGYFKDLYGEGVKATTLTQAAMNNIYDGKFAQIKNKLATPQAEVAYQAILAQHAKENDKAFRDSAMDISSHPGYNGYGRGQQQPQAPDEQAPQQQPTTPGAASDKPPGAQKGEPAWEDVPILKPNAVDLVRKSKTGFYSSDFDKNTTAVNRALAADRLIGQTHGMIDDLYKNAKAGGANEFNSRQKYMSKIVPSIGLPGTEGSVGGNNLQGIFEKFTDASPTMKAFNATRTRLVNEIANATRGTNLGQEEIQKLVNDNLPTYNDSPEEVNRKERNIKLAIKNSVVDLGSLDNLHALNKRK